MTVDSGVPASGSREGWWSAAAAVRGKQPRLRHLPVPATAASTGHRAPGTGEMVVLNPLSASAAAFPAADRIGNVIVLYRRGLVRNP